MKQRHPAYWPVRILLVVGAVSTFAVAAASAGLLVTSWFVPSVQVSPPALAVALIASVVGFAWMVHIARDPIEKTSTWRYRNR